MRIKKLNDEFKLFLHSLEAGDAVIRLLREFSSLQVDLSAGLIHSAVAEQSGFLATGQKTYHVLTSASKILTVVKARDAFRASDLLLAGLDRLANELPEFKEPAGLLHQELRNFIDKYEALLQPSSGVQALDAILAAPPLLLRLNQFAAALASTIGTVDSALRLEPEMEQVAIHFPEDHSLADAANRIQAVANLVEVLESVQGEQVGSSNARIGWAESGSFTLIVILKVATAVMLRQIIRFVAPYIYRNNTREGVLENGIPKAAKALKEMLTVRDALAKRGLSTEDIDSAILQGSSAIAQKTADLLQGTGQVLIDDLVLGAAPPDLGRIGYTRPNALPGPDKNNQA